MRCQPCEIRFPKARKWRWGGSLEVWEQRDLEIICMQVIFFKSKKKKERQVWSLQGKTMHSGLQEEKKERRDKGG